MERTHPLFLTLGSLLIALAAATGQTSQDAKLVEKENAVDTAKPTGAWSPGKVGDTLSNRDRVRTGELSRAAVQLSDLSVLRLDELTTLNIEPPKEGKTKPTIDLASGGAYFFSREKAAEVQVRTPAATGALRGTQLIVRVSPLGKTLLTMLEGEVQMSNAQGSVLLHSGEQGEAAPGQAPHKTAVINAVNLVQWALYYPGVLEPHELGLAGPEAHAVASSLEAYESGDLLGALEKYPHGHQPSTTAGKLYRAGVLLAVGRVDDAEKIIKTVPAETPGRIALEKVIAAVNFHEFSSPHEPANAQEWIAESYYEQSRSKLDAARQAATKATVASPGFGYAWVRLAEMEFSFGRTPEALKALEEGLRLTPRNAQAHSLKGFLLSAQNTITKARDSFETAIALDGALSNAWLGRGLTYIKQGQDARGREDLQVAATLEPNRSILNSYLGKAFSAVGNVKAANMDLKRARELDPKDPTPWLYSAIEDKQENRYNEAVRSLETSISLNDNRSVYRSRFLLDQDKAVSGTNLAAIYLNENMIDQSVREAIEAVNSDYASASAHLFLSNSYDALRDPREIIQRYETAWFSELLISNLLSPVGGGPLSQYVSQQEYSKMFEHDGFGISSSSDYYGYGELRETASQFGTFGNFSYSLDTQDLYEHGFRANDAIVDIDTYLTVKYQLTPQDTVLFKTEYRDTREGFVLDTYDPRTSALSKSDLTYHSHETEEPALILLGYHHEWEPGVHTLLLFGRLADDESIISQDTSQVIASRNITGLTPPGTSPKVPASGLLSFSDIAADLDPYLGRGTVTGVGSLPFDFGYGGRFEIYTGELQQIVEAGPMTFVGGLRYQRGRFETNDILSGTTPSFTAVASLFSTPAALQDYTVEFERYNAYAYDIWKVAKWLTLTGGVTWDKLTYPDNFRSPPVNDESTNFNKLSPKVGFILQPTPSTVFRGAYAKAISGASFDESIRLEPPQIAGFNQAFRTAISEDLIGSVAGAGYTIYGLSLEQKLPTSTYLGIEADLIQQGLGRSVGDFDFLSDPRNAAFSAVLPSQLKEQLHYTEQDLTVTINQLIGDGWSVGVKGQYIRSNLHDEFPQLTTVLPTSTTKESSNLLTTSFYAIYNHPSGFFARAEANWYKQINSGYTVTPGENPQVGDDFWQLNAYAGYRFYRNQCELSLGILNITGRNYRLEPLNPIYEIPPYTTLVAHLRFTF